MKETDIVLDSILDKKKPDDIKVSDDDFLLKTAVFLANKVINAYEENS